MYADMDRHIGDLHPSIVGKCTSIFISLVYVHYLAFRSGNRNHTNITGQDPRPQGRHKRSVRRVRRAGLSALLRRGV